jgi:hypothetical protein
LGEPPQERVADYQNKKEAIYNKPVMDLLYEGATIHKEYQDPNLVQV